MKVRYLINLALLFLVIGLFWLTSNTEEKSLPPLTSVKSAQIQQIRIERENNQDILLQKQENGRWQLKAPVQANANDTRVALLLNVLTINSVNQFEIESVNDLSEFGLDPVKLRLFLNDYEFQFGAIESLSKYRYMRYQQTIHLIDDPISPLLRANAGSFVDNHLFASNEKIRSIQMTGSENNTANLFTIDKEDGHWKSNADKLTADAISKIIAQWQNAYAPRVNTVSTQFTDSDRSIFIQFDNTADPIEMKLRLTATELILGRLNQPIQYHFPISMKQQLFPNLDNPE